MPQLIRQKLVVSGNFLEWYRYEKPFWLGFPQFRSINKKDHLLEKSDLEKKRDRLDNVSRCRKMIRALVDCNIQLDKFCLLTFNRPILSLEEGAFYWKKFVNKLIHHYSKFQYLCVPEFQPNSKRVHYHFLCNLPWIDKELLEEIWGNGWVGISEVEDREHVGYYIAKYVSVDLFDPRYKNKRKFFCSRDLCRPQVYYGDDVDRYFHDLSFYGDLLGLKEWQIDTKFCGFVEYDRMKFLPLSIKKTEPL